MYTKLDVTITKDGDIIRIAKNRYLRKCPDGSNGVVYRKKVFKLYENSIIKIEEKHFEKESCPLLVSNQNDVSPKIDWHLETNKYGHYLVFNGSESLKDEILLLFENNSIKWIRADKSYRPADNDIQYDWFIRLRINDKRSKVVNIVENLFCSFNHDSDYELTKSNLQIEELELEISDLSTKYKKAKIDNEYVLNEAIEYEKKVNNLKDENDRLNDVIEALNNDRLSTEKKLANRDYVSIKAKEKKINGINEMLKGSYPKLKFDEESLFVIYKEITNYEPIFREFYNLVHEKMNYKCKRVKKTKTWWESNSHIFTGKDKNCRLYYRDGYNNKYSYLIRIRMKKTQKRDVEQMIKFERKIPTS